MDVIPTITILGDNPLIIGLGSVYNESGASAIDSQGNTLSVLIENNVDTSTIGDYTATYTTTDSYGNGVTATREIRVRDLTAPVITTGSSLTLKKKESDSDCRDTSEPVLAGHVSGKVKRAEPSCKKESDSECGDTSEPVLAGHVSGKVKRAEPTCNISESDRAALANIGIFLKMSQEDEFEFLRFKISWIITVYNLTFAPSLLLIC